MSDRPGSASPSSPASTGSPRRWACSPGRCPVSSASTRWTTSTRPSPGWPHELGVGEEADVKPLSVSIEVPQSRERVYDFLDVLGNHEQFTDHFLVDWELSGPASGVGAK